MSSRHRQPCGTTPHFSGKRAEARLAPARRWGLYARKEESATRSNCSVRWPSRTSDPGLCRPRPFALPRPPFHLRSTRPAPFACRPDALSPSANRGGRTGCCANSFRQGSNLRLQPRTHLRRYTDLAWPLRIALAFNPEVHDMASAIAKIAAPRLHSEYPRVVTTIADWRRIEFHVGSATPHALIRDTREIGLAH